MARARLATAVLVLLGIGWMGVRGGASAAPIPSRQAAAAPAFDEADLLARLKAAADEGNPDAQFKLGGVYYAGAGTTEGAELTLLLTRVTASTARLVNDLIAEEIDRRLAQWNEMAKQERRGEPS